MAIKRITISVPSSVAGLIKRAAGGKPVSTWVTDLIEERLDDAELERAWQSFYAEVNPTAADKRQADALFARLTRQPKKGARRGS